MSAPFSTILLDTNTWDLTLDTSGNIARTDPPYSIAQDMSSACRLFKSEYIYDADAGVPYNTLLGQSPSLGSMKSDFVAAAQTVPATTNVRCFIAGISERRVDGQVQANVVGSTQTIAAPFATT